MYLTLVLYIKKNRFNLIKQLIVILLKLDFYAMNIDLVYKYIFVLCMYERPLNAHYTIVKGEIIFFVELEAML